MPSVRNITIFISFLFLFFLFFWFWGLLLINLVSSPKKSLNTELVQNISSNTIYGRYVVVLLRNVFIFAVLTAYYFIIFIHF